MNKSEGAASVMDQAWPAHELESVSACPYCGATESTLVCEGVKDWSFECAPGQWSYWRCRQCAALSLNPRPIASSIGRAYARYYTHDAGSHGVASVWRLGLLKQRLVNEFLSHRYGLDLHPRWSLPRCWSWVLHPLKHQLVPPFGFESLKDLPKGRLLDVGCGSGAFLQVAQQLGWTCSGLELDPAAVKAARQQGLNVEVGSYERLEQYPKGFDCIVCSHVLEHVYAPLDLLEKLYRALKPGGTLLLSAPNAMSDASRFFGPHWRGLEAPRHLAIPSASFLREYLESMGLRVSQRVCQTFPTIAESLEIKKKALLAADAETQTVQEIRALLGRPTPDKVDFIELTCVKPLDSVDGGERDE